MKSGSRFRSSHVVCFLAGIMACSTPLWAGVVQPPLQALRNPKLTLVVAELVDGPTADGKLRVRVTERLQGDPEVPDEIELLVDAGDSEEFEKGKEYLVFYSDIERVSFKPETEVRRPDRRLLLHIEGAGPAVFPDTPEMRALLDPGHAEIEQSPGYRQIVMAGMESGDPVMVDLWSAEWALRPATFSEVTAEDAALLSTVVENPAFKPATRARILLTAVQRNSADDGERFVASANVVLEQIQPDELVENSGLSQLIYASLSVAQRYPQASSAPAIERWLKSTPPLAENAALALRAIDPELEREAVMSAIANEGTPETTRTFLAEHLRRAELAKERSG